MKKVIVTVTIQVFESEEAIDTQQDPVYALENEALCDNPDEALRVMSNALNRLDPSGMAWTRE